MSLGIVAKKCGMTEIFTEDGESTAVTAVEILPAKVSQLKTTEKDGYSALQVAYGEKRTSLINKPMSGHLAKAGIESAKGLIEFRMSSEDIANYKLGDAVDYTEFADGKTVKVTGVSKGKGFAGAVKRHNFKMQDATHGNSVSHRALGSTGQCQYPGRVFKGKKMAGQMGNVQVTVRNLKLVKVDLEKNLLFISGGLPGAPGELLLIQE